MSSTTSAPPSASPNSTSPSSPCASSPSNVIILAIGYLAYLPMLLREMTAGRFTAASGLYMLPMAIYVALATFGLGRSRAIVRRVFPDFDTSSDLTANGQDLQAAVGLFLVLQAGGVAVLWHKLRNAGTNRP